MNGGSIIGSVLHLGKELGEKGLETIIYKIGAFLGVQVQNKTIEQVISDIKREIQNPESKRKLEELNSIIFTVLEVAKPGITKLLDEMEHLAKDMGKRGIVVGQELLSEVPIVGPLIELPIIISNIVRAGEKVVESGVKLTGIGVDTLNEIHQTIAEKKRQIDSMTHQIKQYNVEGDNTLRRVQQSTQQFMGGSSLVRQKQHKKTAKRRSKHHH